ncbi:MAG: hypothetical protein HY657_10700 [Acidobacteria bacterium]|nr:hypothetical protein [Acidobacteriota bacterium]
MSSPLADFTARLLTRHGALVEHDRGEIVAVMPPPLATELGVAEYQRFAFDRRTAGPHALVVDYESPLVERFGRLVDTIGRIAGAPPPHVALKALDPEEVVTRAITLTNGVIRDCRVEAGCARYVGFMVRFELLADERISGMTEVWVNHTTRSVPRLEGLVTRLLSRREGTVDATAEPAACDDVRGIVAGAWATGAAVARRQVENRLLDAIASLRRRRERDFERLREYYQAIDEEIRRRARRALTKRDEAAVKAETSRLDATAHAFRGRVAELVDRYRVRVRLEPLATVVCTLPVHHITARIYRRSASRTIAVAWNAIDRALESPACDGCGAGVSTATLCDDRVHVLCSGCQGDCETCGRSYCKACHTRCPRQHR